MLVVGILGMHGAPGAVVTASAAMAPSVMTAPHAGMDAMAASDLRRPARPAPVPPRHDMHQMTPCLAMMGTAVVLPPPHALPLTTERAQPQRQGERAARERLQHVHAPPDVDLAMLCILRT